jgi:hypothetical protein
MRPVPTPAALSLAAALLLGCDVQNPTSPAVLDPVQAKVSGSTVEVQFTSGVLLSSNQVMAGNNGRNLFTVKKNPFVLSHNYPLPITGCRLGDGSVIATMQSASPMNGSLSIDFLKNQLSPTGAPNLNVGYQVTLAGVTYNTSYTDFQSVTTQDLGAHEAYHAVGGIFRAWSGGVLVERCDGGTTFDLNVSK